MKQLQFSALLLMVCGIANAQQPVIRGAPCNSGVWVTNSSGITSCSSALPNGTTATTQSSGDNTTAVATDAFVQAALAGVNPAVAVQAATTAAADTSGLTYNNGLSGVGATLTGANNTALTVDGFTFTTLGQRLLVKNDTQSPSGAFNGVYYVTQVQASLLPLILTRALDYDQPSDINNTGAIPVQSGTVNGGTSWLLTSQVTTVGTSPLTYVQFTYGSFPAPANGLATNSSGKVLAQTSANVASEWTGTCPAGVTSVLGTNGVNQCITTFPNSNLRGTFLGLGLNNSSAGTNLYVPFSSVFALLAACAGTTTQFFLMPTGGFVRNTTANISGTNANSQISVNTVPNCATAANTVGLPNSLIVPPGAVAGAYFNTWSTNPSNYQHVNQYESFGMLAVSGATTPAAVMNSIGSEFISDDGTADSILGIGSSSLLSASSTQFYGFDYIQNSTEANVEIPLPIAGTLKNLMVSFGSASPTNNVVVTLNKNAVNQTLTVTALGGGDITQKYVDVIHTVSVSPGDYIDLQTASGASTQTTFKAASVLFVPGDGLSAILHGSFNAGTVTTTAKYAQAFSAQTSTTEANTEYTFPMACSVSHLYVYQATANGAGVITTLTVFKNNVSTAVTGTITNGSGTGSIAVDTTHSVSFAQGDRFSLQYVTGSGTSGTMSGWGAQCN